VEPLVYALDGFVVTLWSYEHQAPHPISPGDYARALEQLHEGMRRLDIKTQHYTDRVAEAQEIVEHPDRSPELEDADRELLSHLLRRQRRAVDDRAAVEQLLHGEPHPGNLLSTSDGPLFIDIETCCRGPVEFDLAHVPEAVSERYPNADQALLQECRALVLAMVAAWRWDREDQLPNGRQAGRDLLDALRKGPPWPALTTVLPPN
jgi:thiamine kinase-like enzyme